MRVSDSKTKIAWKTNKSFLIICRLRITQCEIVSYNKTILPSFSCNDTCVQLLTEAYYAIIVIFLHTYMYQYLFWK